ncbi:hypothetical protein B5X24_HaOG212158 [Helicoverpa armigera]|nr:hypothetical protein B5X24_HaOG212158 [Helicoverpa armigera]
MNQYWRSPCGASAHIGVINYSYAIVDDAHPWLLLHHHADSSEDTVEHTVQVCTAWEGYRRRVVVEAIGSGDLSRPSLVQAMVRSWREWEAVASFCEAVMLEKEAAERLRVAPLIPAAVVDQEDTTGAKGRETTPGHRRRRSVGGEFGWLIVPLSA